MSTHLHFKRTIAPLSLVLLLIVGLGISRNLLPQPQTVQSKAESSTQAVSNPDGKWGSMPTTTVEGFNKSPTGIDTFLFLRFSTKEDMVDKLKPFAGKFSYLFPDIDLGNPQRKKPDGTYTNAPFFEGAQLLSIQDPSLKLVLGGGAAIILHKSSMNYAVLNDSDFFHNPDGTPTTPIGPDWRYENIAKLQTVDKVARYWQTNTTQYPSVVGFFLDSYGNHADHFVNGCLEFGAQCKDPNFWYQALQSSSNRYVQTMAPGKEVIFNGIFYNGTPDPGANQGPGRMNTNFLDANTGALAEHVHRVIEGKDVFESYLWAANATARKHKKLFFWFQPDMLTIHDPGLAFTKDVTLERYYLAYYLLLQEKGYTFFGYHPDIVYGADYGIFYYKDWLFNYGDPVGPYHTVNSPELYYRLYSNGYAVVNNTTEPQQFPFQTGGSFREWDPFTGPVISGTATVPPKSGKFFFSPLPAPGSFTITQPLVTCSGSNSLIKLSWNAPTNGPSLLENSGYFVYIDGVYHSNNLLNSQFDDHETKVATRSYKYKIEAVTTHGNTFSNEVSVQPKDCNAPTPPQKPGDIGGNQDGSPDGKVNIQDYVLLFESYAKKPGEPGYHARADINHDSKVDVLDYVLLFENFGS